MSSLNQFGGWKEEEEEEKFSLKTHNMGKNTACVRKIATVHACTVQMGCNISEKKHLVKMVL